MSYDYYLTCHDCKEKLWAKRGDLGWSVRCAQQSLTFLKKHLGHSISQLRESWFNDNDEYTDLGDYPDDELVAIRVRGNETGFIYKVISDFGDYEAYTPKLQAQFTRIFNNKKGKIEAATLELQELSDRIGEVKSNIDWIQSGINEAPLVSDIFDTVKEFKELQWSYESLDRSKQALSDEFFRFVKKYKRL